MGFTRIDFQGIINLDRKVADQLNAYLEQKEAHLGRDLILIVQNYVQDPLTPSPTPPDNLIRLHDAVELFGKKIHEIEARKKQMPSQYMWQSIADQVNRLSWNYLIILEGFVTELFQQLKLIGIEYWRKELTQTVEMIKMTIMQHLEELKWMLKRMEAHLWQLRWFCEAQAGKLVCLRKLFAFSQSMIDRSLKSNLLKTKKFLSFQYQKVAHQFREFLALKEQVATSVQQLYSGMIFNHLDDDSKAKYRRLYELLKLWDLNESSKSLPQGEMIRAIRNVISPVRATGLLKDYHHLLKKELFKRALAIKTPNALDAGETEKYFVNEVLANLRRENASLAGTIHRFRNYMLKTDADPYSKKRWGTGSLASLAETLETIQLVELEYESERLDRYFDLLRQAIEKGGDLQETSKIEKINLEIQKTLNEMAQPLSSLQMMKRHADKVLDHIAQLSELNSFSPHVIGAVDFALSRALRYDWKYHILFDSDRFKELYNVHLGLVSSSLLDRKHVGRLGTFRRLTRQILDWIKAKATNKHIHEIELDVNDIKGYLQDFLANVQRFCKEKDFKQEEFVKQINEASYQLLEYRYVFGQFFHELRDCDADARYIRNQFLFVDQYFEAVDNLLDLARREISERNRPQNLTPKEDAE